MTIKESNSSVCHTESETKFKKSLQELKELRFQLHHAADYCEKTFLETEKKKAVVRKTKEYMCRAVVTVVDHLGSVSANLECQLSKCDTASDAEHRIDRLRQGFLTCQQSSHKLPLQRSWSSDLPRYHCRYISPSIPDLKRMKEMSWESSSQIAAEILVKDESEAEEEVLLLLNSYKPSGTSLVEDAERSRFSPPVIPVRRGLCVLPRAQNSYFEFQEARKLKRNTLNWKMKHNKDIMSLIRRGKRTVT